MVKTLLLKIKISLLTDSGTAQRRDFRRRKADDKIFI